MNFFKKSERKSEEQGAQMVEEGLLQHVLQYVQALELPEPSEKIEVRLLTKGAAETEERGRFAVRAPQYILVYAKEGPDGLLNAGYVMERLAAILHTYEIDSQILMQFSDTREKLSDGKHPVAALAFGMRRRKNRNRKKNAERPFFCHEAGDRWTEEVLSYAKELLTPRLQTGVRMVRKENAIHLAAGKIFCGGVRASQFHAGIVLAAVMAAAEELWMDLSMVRIGAELQTQNVRADYLISVCRKQDCSLFETVKKEGRESRQHTAPRPGRSFWRYA